VWHGGSEVEPRFLRPNPSTVMAGSSEAPLKQALGEGILVPPYPSPLENYFNRVISRQNFHEHATHESHLSKPATVRNTLFGIPMSTVNNKTQEAPKGPAHCRHGVGCKYRQAGICRYLHPDSHGSPSLDHLGKNKTKITEKSHKKVRASGVRPSTRMDVRSAIKVIAPHVEKIRLLRANAAGPPTTPLNQADTKGWMMVPGTDAKIAAAELATAVAEMNGVAALLRQNLGRSGTKLSLPVTIQVNNTAAGLCRFVTNVDVGACADWASLQVLFDEYRWNGADFNLFPQAGSVVAISMSAGQLYIGYDPADASVLTNAANAAELQHHKVVHVPSNAGTLMFQSQHQSPITLKVRVKPDEVEAITSAGAVSYTPGMWKILPTAGMNVAYDGTIKFFWENNVAGAAAGVASLLSFYHVQFRSRT